MKRWHEERSLSKRQYQKHVDRWNFAGKAANKGIGFFRKHKAGDCGRPKCGICHSEKYPKREITKQEKLSNLKMKEDL